MQTITLTRKLESETLPELRPFVGREVEITIRETTATPNSLAGSVLLYDDSFGPAVSLQPTIHPRADWEAALADIADLDIDWDACRRQREFDTQHAQDHLP